MPQRSVDLDFLERSKYIAPGQMGYIRGTMFKRETLQRAPLGEHYTRGRPKQPPGFIYGMQYERDPYALLKCLHWPEYKPPVDPRTFRSDYTRINVESAKANIHAVPVWEKFRKAKNFHVDPTQAQGLRFLKPQFPDDMIFGKPPRPITPLGCLLAHQYKTEFDKNAIE